eukprot:Nk52_evm9s375 gene=Nk52_evmTU9s375
MGDSKEKEKTPATESDPQPLKERRKSVEVFDLTDESKDNRNPQQEPPQPLMARRKSKESFDLASHDHDQESPYMDDQKENKG